MDFIALHVELKQQSTGMHVAPLGHIHYSWPTNILHLNPVHLSEKCQLSIVLSSVWPELNKYKLRLNGQSSIDNPERDNCKIGHK